MKNLTETLDRLKKNALLKSLQLGEFCTVEVGIGGSIVLIKPDEIDEKLINQLSEILQQDSFSKFTITRKSGRTIEVSKLNKN